jgi:outer membrane immunogenic protein
VKTRILTGLASLTLFDIAAASAQTPVPSWAGFYIGAHAGGRFADVDVKGNSYPITVYDGLTPTIPGLNISNDLSSAIGGAHLGYNWQFTNFLFGLEGDWSWGRDRSYFSRTFSGVQGGAGGDSYLFRQQSVLTLEWQASLRARAGLVAQTALWYVTGGVAFANVKWSDATSLRVIDDGLGTDITTSTASSAQKTLVGWVVGAGFEQMLSPNFTWRIEYLFESFDGFNVPEGLGPRIGTLDLDSVQKVRIGFTFNM